MMFKCSGYISVYQSSGALREVARIGATQLVEPCGMAIHGGNILVRQPTGVNDCHLITE